MFARIHLRSHQHILRVTIYAITQIFRFFSQLARAVQKEYAPEGSARQNDPFVTEASHHVRLSLPHCSSTELTRLEVGVENAERFAWRLSMNGTLSYISLPLVGTVVMIQEFFVSVQTCTRCSNDAPALQRCCLSVEPCVFICEFPQLLLDP